MKNPQVSSDHTIDLEEYNVFNQAFNDDPHAFYRKLLSLPNAIRSEMGMVVLTHADTVESTLRDKSLWSDPRKANPGTPTSFLLNEENRDEQPSMLFADDPLHKRLRSLASQAFTPRSVESWRERTREIAESLLDAVQTEFDLIDSFAGPLPTVVIAEILGVDPTLKEWFKQCSDASSYAFFNPLSSTDNEKAAGQKGRDELSSYFAEEVKRRRTHPGEDLISKMIQASLADGDTYTDEEIVTQCNLLLIAGNITTTDLIGNGVHALLTHRKQWDLLCSQPDLVNNAVEELLRFCAPVTNSGRIASKSTEIEGCPIHKGETYSLVLAAANRDPAICERPDELDITRQKIQHWSFGGGKHFCLGAPLARLEAQEALLVLSQKFPSLRLVDGSEKLRTMPGFRGFLNLRVKCS